MAKASTKAKNKYNATAYDRINLIVPKGKKEIIKNYADDHGMSVNNCINLAIDNYMSEEHEEQ